jgi:hypothetical protein
VRDATLDELHDWGVDVVRIQLTWATLAPERPSDPSDPAAYGPVWGAYDGLVAAAQERGLRVLATLSSPAPNWAAGLTGTEFPGTKDPDAAAFRDFAHAVGRHFDGVGAPLVEFWSIWNEPNYFKFLSPQVRDGVPYSAKLYRDLVRAATAGLRSSGHTLDSILIGESLPIASHGGSSTQHPIDFARELLCLDARGRPLGGPAALAHPGCSGSYEPLDVHGWGVHLYYRFGGPFVHPPTPVDIAPIALGALKRTLDSGTRAGRLPRGMGIWNTESGSQTNPPDPKGVSLLRQARYMNEAEFLAWRTPYVRSFSQYPLQDDLRVRQFQSGLRFRSGTDKPSLSAYRLPLYVGRAPHGAVDVWGRIPRGGSRTAMLERSVGGVVEIHVRDRRGYFLTRIPGPLARGAAYRLRYGRLLSRVARARR